MSHVGISCLDVGMVVTVALATRDLGSKSGSQLYFHNIPVYLNSSKIENPFLTIRILLLYPAPMHFPHTTLKGLCPLTSLLALL